jgi:hypothetical protein
MILQRSLKKIASLLSVKVHVMRACVLCKTSVQEICVDLTATDDEEFVCPFCEK